MTIKRRPSRPGVAYVEVATPAQLPEGKPAPAERKNDRGEGGRFASGNSLAARGARARRARVALAQRMGLKDPPAGSAFEPYARAAKDFREAQCRELARNVGGGYCGPSPSAIVATAAMQLAWSRYLSDKAAETDDADLAIKASRLADASRQSLLAAHELCAREAQARPRAPVDPLAV